MLLAISPQHPKPPPPLPFLIHLLTHSPTRALTPLHCYLSAEFWIRYVLWCEAHPDSSSSSSTPAAEAPAVLARAVGTFCRKHPGLAIFAARFHEGRGDVAAAREQYQQLVTNLAPGLIEVGGYQHVLGSARGCVGGGGDPNVNGRPLPANFPPPMF